MADRDGIKGVMAEAVSEASQQLAAQASPAPSMDDLFNIPAAPDQPQHVSFDKQGNVTSGGLTPQQVSEEAERQRKAGRPKGAVNRSTRELKEFILKTGTVPQLWMVRWLNLEPEQLAQRLRCSIEKAFDFQLTIARELGEYIIPKMARTDGQGNAVPLMGLFVNGQIMDPQSPLPAGALKPWLYPGADNDLVDIEHEEAPAA